MFTETGFGEIWTWFPTLGALNRAGSAEIVPEVLAALWIRGRPNLCPWDVCIGVVVFRWHVRHSTTTCFSAGHFTVALDRRFFAFEETFDLERSLIVIREVHPGILMVPQAPQATFGSAPFGGAISFSVATVMRSSIKCADVAGAMVE